MARNILLFSDLHLHSHKRNQLGDKRLQDCLDVLDWVFRTALEKEVEDILFLGDLFHDRQKIEVLTIHRVIDVFERYFDKYSNLRLWMLLGNHDLWHRDKRDVYSPKLLANFPGITVIDQPCTLKIADHCIDFLPFTENPIHDLDFLRNNVPRKKGERRLLCGHIAIDGANLNSFGTQANVIVEHDGDMIKIDPGFLSGWNKVFLGHYHGEQAVTDRVEYIGSPLQLSFGESFQQKHIVLFDLDTFQKEFIVNDFSPVHLILKPEDLDNHDLKNNFVSLKVDDIGSASILDIRREILEKHEVGTLQISAVKKAIAPDVMDKAKAIMYQDDKMLERYVEENKEEGLAPDKLLELGLTFCQESM